MTWSAPLRPNLLELVGERERERERERIIMKKSENEVGERGRED